MFSKFYVRKLSDTIISGNPLSFEQLFFLVDIVADYMYEYDSECYDDINRAKLSLLEKISYLDENGRR